MVRNQPDLFHRPVLSIILSAYNSARYLDESIESILSQDFSDIEVVAVNDGSEDQSGAILDTFAKKDPRLQVFHCEHKGISAVRNFGLEQSNGIYIYFFDGNHRLAPGALRHTLRLMQETGSEIIGFSQHVIDEIGQQVESSGSSLKPDVTNPVPGEDLLVKMMGDGTYSPVISTYIYRKSFLQNSYSFFQNGSVQEDEFYTIRSLCKADRVLSLSSPYSLYRFRNGSLNGRKPGIGHLKERTRVISQLLSFVNRYPMKEDTDQMILRRAARLTHNCMDMIERLQKKERTAISINDYLTKEELSQLGFGIQTRLQVPALFNAWNRIRRWIMA